jgi:ankyrin repeat protein
MRIPLPPRLTGALAVALILAAATAAPDPLLDAVRRGDLATVRSLLQGRANPNTAQPSGLSALHLAAQRGSIEIAKHLIDAGATVNAPTDRGGYTPLHLAAGAGQTEMVSFLLFARADVDAVTADRVTPLHLAAQAQNGEGAVRELIRRGAPVNAREATADLTPIMFADAAGRAAAVRELLAAGADPGAASPETAGLLLRLGAEIACLDTDVGGADARCRDPAGLE